MSTDLATRIHELVRRPNRRSYFRAQVERCIAERVANPKPMCWPLQLAHPNDWEPELCGESRPITLAEKCAALAAWHDQHYPNDGPIMDRGDDSDSPSRAWGAMLDHVERNGGKLIGTLED